MSKKGPLFTIRTDRRQMRVGKPKQPVAVLEIREPGPLQGQELLLTERDLDFILFGIAVDRGVEAQRAFLEWQMARDQARSVSPLRVVKKEAEAT